ncbi:hypothetical protein [Kineococcus rhizosphaerae]|uniref:Uncharacterized protein n=1 Tax=Kineococcus rhizosphaerae TaxID=559628 RepID=A0A2T0QYF3_9ACTN|nr:hypothetical protein [Kineococcus rhizosphaerae]PRY11412.1 hypothetical protein CLV37_11333 [Kineococcus rhizosphaerae]
MSSSKSRIEKLQKGTALAGTVALASKVAPAVESAVDWAQPRLEKAWDTTRETAAPHVGAAAQRVSPAVDTARDKIVDDLLPKIVEAVQDAAAAAQKSAAPVAAAAGTAAVAASTSARDTIKDALKEGRKAEASLEKSVAASVTTSAKKASTSAEKAKTKAKTRAKATRKAGKVAAKAAKKVAAQRSSDALAVLKGEAVAKRKGRAGKRFLVFTLVAAGGAAVYAVVRNSQKEDPWSAPGAAWTPAPATTTPTTPAAAASTENLEKATGDQSTTDATVADVTPIPGVATGTAVDDGTDVDLDATTEGTSSTEDTEGGRKD